MGGLKESFDKWRRVVKQGYRHILLVVLSGVIELAVANPFSEPGRNSLTLLLWNHFGRWQASLLLMAPTFNATGTRVYKSQCKIVTLQAARRVCTEARMKTKVIDNKMIRERQSSLCSDDKQCLEITRWILQLPGMHCHVRNVLHYCEHGQPLCQLLVDDCLIIHITHVSAVATKQGIQLATI